LQNDEGDGETRTKVPRSNGCEDAILTVVTVKLGAGRVAGEADEH